VSSGSPRVSCSCSVLRRDIFLPFGYLVRAIRRRSRICSRVDYVNGLQEELEGQQAASEEVREQFKILVEECRAVLSNRAQEND
jgi:hypothetical protein